MTPARELLGHYVEALQRGWSPDNLRRDLTAAEHLEAIARDADGFLARHIDPEAKGKPVELPDGSIVPRLPGITLWMWDGEFAGSINLRWQRGTSELPPHVLGHIGYSVVPWKQRRGYASAALGMVLPHARQQGLEYVTITCDPANEASRKVIEANGGVLVERFVAPHHGEAPRLRYRIDLGR